MYFVRAKDKIKIAVEDINPDSKSVIMFIHGWPLNHMIFEYQVNVLSNLGYRVISIDLRGFGASDTSAKGYSYEQMARDIREVIETLDLKKIILAGFSMGGSIAIKYASLFKDDRISKLVLMAAAAPSFVKRENYPYGMSTNSVNSLIDRAYKDRPSMVSDFSEMLFFSNPSKSLREWFKNIGLSASGIGTIECAMSLKNENLMQDLKEINIPTAIFHGKMDKICPYEFAKVLNEGIKDSRIYTFENSGHAIFYDELEKFNKELIDFLEEDV